MNRIPFLAMFNNKGGVGKTSMVYHLAWMLAQKGVRVVAADLDPQSNLTAAFLDEDELVELTAEGAEDATLYHAVEELIVGRIGDVRVAPVREVADGLGLVPGDMRLSSVEDQLSKTWPECLSRDPGAFRVASAFYRSIHAAAVVFEADLVLLDLGPNLGALNRSALVASDHVMIPLGADLFSLQGLQNLGPKLREWRLDWVDRLERNPIPQVLLPTGKIDPIGYAVLRHSMRLSRPVKAYRRWIDRIPPVYAESVLEEAAEENLSVETDPHCLATLKDYRSLMPLAQEARKPMFLLKPADGALGSHMAAVHEAYRDFETVADRVLAAVATPESAAA